MCESGPHYQHQQEGQHSVCVSVVSSCVRLCILVLAMKTKAARAGQQTHCSDDGDVDSDWVTRIGNSWDAVAAEAAEERAETSEIA